MRLKLFFSIIFIFFVSSLAATEKNLLIATTTSLDNSSFLDYIAPKFTRDTQINLHWIAVGSGQAFTLGKHCSIDALLTHAPKMEQEFLQKKLALSITPIMHNDFVLVGTADDPAQIKNLPATPAFHKIALKQALFISRGDNSGTQVMENMLWQKSGIIPQNHTWYLESGQNMLATLNVAAIKNAYTLTDRATFTKFTLTNSKLKILVTDPKLYNQYNLILLSPKYCSHINQMYAATFKNWLLRSSTQKLINHFKIAKQQVFWSQF